MFLPEQVEQNDFCDFKYADDEMWIVWNKMKPNEGGGSFTSYYIRDRWNAEMAYNWLTKEFIPYLIWHYEISKTDKYLKFGIYKKFKSKFEIDKYIWN